MTNRRRFLAKASGAIAVAATAALVDAPNVIAQPKVQWRMSTTWTKALDVLQGAAQRLAKDVEETSGGRFRIEVFPGGQIMQPFECFEAASQGKIEAFMGGPVLLDCERARVRVVLYSPVRSELRRHGRVVLPG
jgi:TRAP-type mannitol/chloroaromatic compound transport system substrate-binding protein